MKSRLSILPVLTIQVVLVCILICATIALKSDANDLILSLKEKSALDLFKQDVEDFLPDKFMKTDFYLIRWLRVANLNIPEARKRLFQTVKWREQNNITKILSEDWSDMEEECPMTFEGVDKEGRPVRAIDAGDWDVRAISLHGRLSRLLRYFDYANEKQMQQILKIHEETAKPVTRFVILFDTYEVNLRQHVTCPQCLSMLMQWYTGSEVHYPEFLAEAIVINAPTAVPLALAMLKPVMPPDIRERIKVFDGNKNAWMTYLDSRIDRNNRRERYGGILKNS